MTPGIGLWARLTNAQRSVDLASGDWQRIFARHCSLTSTSNDRCSDDDGTWRWTAEEARALAEALVAGGARQCIGGLMVDLAIGERVRGTGCELVADGLTSQQRTERLIQFLREGSFRWRFITGPRGVPVGGPDG